MNTGSVANPPVNQDPADHPGSEIGGEIGSEIGNEIGDGPQGDPGGDSLVIGDNDSAQDNPSTDIPNPGGTGSGT